MKKYIVTVLLLLIGVTAFAQVQKGVTHKGEVTSVKNQGEVDLHGQIDSCPRLTQYGEIIEYNSAIQPFTAGLDGTVNIVMSITVTSVGNAYAVGFDCATDTNFTTIIHHSSFASVTLGQYTDTIRNLTPGEKYFVRAYISNCPGDVFSDTISVVVPSAAVYTLSFFAHGGSGTMTDQDFSHGVPQNIKQNEFTRANADFAGWADDPSGCGSLYDDEESLTLTSSDSLFAQWRTWCTGKRKNNENGATENRIDSVKDHQGHWYNVVQIGSQCWLAENMRATTLPGSSSSIIELPHSGSSSTLPRAYYYDDNSSYADLYGCLYNYPAAVSIVGDTTLLSHPHRGICPEGWHLPTDAEWDTLAIVAGTNTMRGSGLGKLTAGCFWSSVSGTTAPGNVDYMQRNTSGFAALPVGGYDGSNFYGLGTSAIYWSATTNYHSIAYRREFRYNSEYVDRYDNGRDDAFSVRCLRDDLYELDSVVLDSAACTSLEVHALMHVGEANSYTVTAYKDSACTQTVGGVTQNISSAKDSIYARIWNLDGNTNYYVRITAKDGSREDTVIGKFRTACFCTVSRALNQVDNVTFKNYEWGSTTAGVTRVDSVSDHEGNRYSVVQIGAQCWTRENGRVLTSPSTGDSLLKWNNTSTYSAYKREARWVNYDTVTYKYAGPLYNWCAMADYESGSTTVNVPAWYANRQGLCPKGWHMMTQPERTLMFSYISNSYKKLAGNRWSTSSTMGSTTDPLRNQTGFSLLPSAEWKSGNNFVNFDQAHLSCIDQASNTTFPACVIKQDAGCDFGFDTKDHSHNYRCLRDGDVVLSPIVMDSISCTSAYFHAVVLNGTIDAGNTTDNRCGVSDSVGFISNDGSLGTSAAYKGTLRISNDTIYGKFDNTLTCNKRYNFYIKVYSADKQAYGIQLSDSTRDLSMVKPTSCVVADGLHTAEYSATDLSREEGTADTLTAVYDHQGNRYNVVQIGNQCWLKENMRATTSPTTGSRLIITTRTLSKSSKAAYWYNDDSTTYSKYGVLYNWCATVDTFYAADPTNHPEVAASTGHTSSAWTVTLGADRRGICPAGWHVPDESEWTTLANATGVSVNSGSGVIKIVGSCDWTSTTYTGRPGYYNDITRNSTGFSAMPGGVFADNSGPKFWDVNLVAHFWAATPYGTEAASHWYINNNNTCLSKDNGTRRHDSYTIRCVRNARLDLGDVTLDTAACSYLEVHSKVLAGTPNTYTVATFADSACTQTVGGVTHNITVAKDSIYARLWNLDGNTTYYVRITAQGNGQEDTVIGKFSTACFCTVTRALNQTDNSTYKNYEWGVSGATTSRVDSVSDHEGHRYGVVQIGQQCWTRENGRVVTSPSTGDSLLKWDNNSTYSNYRKEARWLRYDTVTFKYAGPVYNWCALADYGTATYPANVPAWYANRRGLCPEGWHMMTQAEWGLLYNGKTIVDVQGGPMVSGGSETAWPTTYANYANRNSTGFTGLACGEWQGPNTNNFTNMGTLHLANIDQLSESGFKYVHIKQTEYSSETDPKNHSHNYRCLRDGDVVLSPIVMDSITCTSAYFHAVVLNGTIDANNTDNRCGVSDSTGFISNNGSLGTSTAHKGTLRISHDTIYGKFDNTLTCNKRYNFYIKVYSADKQSYGVQLSDSTRDLSMVKPTSCVVTDSLHTAEYSATDHSREEGTADTLTAVYDHQGNRYNVVQIGNQCWLKENMRATTSPTTGSRILLSSKIQSKSSKAAFWFNTDSTANSKYGVMYNWCAAVDTFYAAVPTNHPEVAATTGHTSSDWAVTLGADRRGVCPAGWHVPTIAEYEIMAGAAGVQVSSGTGAIKLVGGCDWNSASSNTPGDYANVMANRTGFSALPAGYYPDGSNNFNGLKDEVNFWTASTPANANANRMILQRNYTYMRLTEVSRYSAYSVRCVRNASLDLGAVTLDSAACSFVDVHAKVLVGTPTAYTAAAFADSACTQLVGGNTVNISAAKDSIYARLWNLEGNTTYFVRITAQGNGQEDTVIGKFRTACFCTVTRALNQTDISTFKNYEWGVSGATTSRVDSVSDHEGHRYGVVQIGAQCWTRENGRVLTSPSTGDSLLKWTDNSTTAYYRKEARWIRYNPTKYGYFGPVYNWCALADYETSTSPANVPAWFENRRGLCPEGWHMMTSDEWAVLGINSTSQIVRIQGGPMDNGGDTTWNSGYATNSLRNITGLTVLAGNQWTVGGPWNAAGTANFSAINQSNSTEFAYYYIQNANYSTGNDPKCQSHSYRCLRDGDVVLGELVMDTISCTSAKFHAVVLNGSNYIDWTNANNRCGVSDSTGFISNMTTSNTYMGAISHRGDTIFGEFNNTLTCNKRYTFYFKVFGTDKQSYGVQLSDSTRDLNHERPTSCVVSGGLRTTAFSGTDLSREEGSNDTLTAVYDHQGNRYEVVQMGNQCWMKQSMRATTSPTTGTYLVRTDNLYSYSGKAAKWTNTNDSTRYRHFGLLYNWNAANDVYKGSETFTSSDGTQSHAVDTLYAGPNRGICPAGWHVPATSEMAILVSNYPVAATLSGGCDWTANGTTNVPGNRTCARHNESGFSLLPAGRYVDGGITEFTQYARMWTSNQHSSNKHNGLGYSLQYNSAATLSQAEYYKYQRLSVRCVRDVKTTLTSLRVSDMTCNTAVVSGRVTNCVTPNVDTIQLNLKHDFSDVPQKVVVNIATDSTFNVTVTGLITDTLYFVTMLGDTTSFHTERCACKGDYILSNENGRGEYIYSVTDADNNTYSVIQIGDQCWLRENLRCRVSPSTGTNMMVNYVSSLGKSAVWSANDSARYVLYGILYNVCAALDFNFDGHEELAQSGDSYIRHWHYENGIIQGVCPTGWHVPSDAEMVALENFIVTQNHYGENTTPSPAFGTIYADHTKYETPNESDFMGRNTYLAPMVASSYGWNTSSVSKAAADTTKRNITELNITPGGDFSFNAPSGENLGNRALLWTSTYDPNAWSDQKNKYTIGHSFAYDIPGVARLTRDKSVKMNVRCMRDDHVFDTIKFFAHGGTGTMDYMVIKRNADTVLNAISGISHPNADFAGWNTRPDGTGVAYADHGAINTNKPLKLYAQWNTYCAGSPRNSESGSGRVDSVQDIQGNWYKVVQIGNRCWLKENMRATASPSGELQQNTTTTNESMKPRYYDNATMTGLTARERGLLYNWAGAMDTTFVANVGGVDYPRHRGICPEGWILPTDQDWFEMEREYLTNTGWTSSTVATGSSTGFRGKGAERFVKGYYWKLRIRTDEGLVEVKTDPGCFSGTERNLSGFTVYPTGRFDAGIKDTTTYAYFWTATSNDGNAARYRSLVYDQEGMNRDNAYKYNGYSVRCIRDTNTTATITFYSNDSAQTSTTQAVTAFENVNLDANTFVRPNATFAGWNSKPSGCGTAYTDQQTIYPSGNLQLYAQWNTFCAGTPRLNEKGTSQIDSVSDHEGNTYSVVTINGVCIMKQNLRVISSPVGNTILRDSTSSTAKSHYFVSSQFGKEGYLYNWRATMDLLKDVSTDNRSYVTANHRGLCPMGWHVPTQAEYNTLVANYNAGQFAADNCVVDGTGSWTENTTANAPGNAPAADLDKNKSLFSAVPAGVAYSGAVNSVGQLATFWTATPNSGYGNSYNLCLNYNSSTFPWNNNGNQDLRSVRCIRNAPATVTITFDANGGTGDMVPQDVDAYATTTLSANTFVKDNATFASWNTERSGCGVSYNDVQEIIPETNLTLYAQWNTHCPVAARSNEMGGTRVDSVKDHQDNWYKVVQIGDQCWLKENMRCTTSPSTHETIVMNPMVLSKSSKSAGYYANDSTTYGKYGVLYNWCAAVDTFYAAGSQPELANAAGHSSSDWTCAELTNRRGICPTGWHIPTDSEWTTMISNAGVSESTGTTGLGKLVGGCDWRTISTATAPGNYSYAERDSTCFSALPAGIYWESGFYGVGDIANFWSATPVGTNTAYYRHINYTNEYASRDNYSRYDGFSVRCVRDN